MGDAAELRDSDTGQRTREAREVPQSLVASPLTPPHLQRIRHHYDSASELTWAAAAYRRTLARYYNLLLPPNASVLEVGCGDGSLLALLNAKSRTGVDVSPEMVRRARARLPKAEFHVQSGEELALDRRFDAIVVSDTLNYAADVQQFLSRLLTVSDQHTRLLLNFYNTLWRPVLSAGERLGVRQRPPESSWLSGRDVVGLLQLAGWDVVKTQSRLLWPLETPIVAPLLNRALAPLLPWACLTVFAVARPRPVPSGSKPTVSVLVPARNEAGNIAAAVERTPVMGGGTELIFVEGGSRDDTWATIQRVQAEHPERRIKALQQTGRGKGNAVREGFAVASGEILVILDADLTMPPEELPKFYDALVSGSAELANGCRLVYPMERRAMRFANMVANKLFGVAFSWLLGQHIKDTLCGTKALWRAAYEQIAANRSYFGDFDPFGDFDLLFGADKLGLKIVDIPIRYRDRTYGDTNIQRWRHGLLLARMVAFAARKLKFV